MAIYSQEAEAIYSVRYSILEAGMHVFSIPGGVPLLELEYLVR